MIRSLFALVLALVIGASFGQTCELDTASFAIPEDSVYVLVDSMPQFPGGESEFFKWIGENIKYPQDAQDNGIEGVVFVSFVVEKDGSTGQSRILRGIHKSCDDEVLRLVDSFPDWAPGLCNGGPVATRYNLPIKFTLKGKKPKKKKEKK